MIRAVLDVNVLVSGFPSPDSIPGLLIGYWLAEEFKLVTSVHILQGTNRVWKKDYFRFRFREEQVQNSMNALRRLADIVEPAPHVRNVADDDEDDLVLATAVSGDADYLVTGDKGLLRHCEYESIVIMSPRDFLNLLTASFND
jgi:putative PIN family toxin of toxin-antitoxin system